MNPIQSYLDWINDYIHGRHEMSFGIVQAMKLKDELKQRVPTDLDVDYNDRISIMVEVDGIEGETEVVCEMDIEDQGQEDDGTPHLSVSVKWSSTLQGLPFPLTKLQEETAISDWWKKQERLAEEARNNEH